MMTAAEFIHADLRRLHGMLDKALADLTPAQLHTVPAGHPKANTLAWVFWHYARTEDFLAKTPPADLEATVTVKPLGEMPGVRALGQTCLSHGMTHAGEIELMRTLIGVGPAIGV